jgi:hypothetical protein
MTPDAIRQAYRDVVRDEVAVAFDRLRELVVARLGGDVPADLDTFEDAVLDDPESPLAIAHPDVVVHVPALTAGIVLTHRLSAAEHVEGYLDLDTDLAGFLRVAALRVPEGSLETEGGGPEPLAWGGPAGWLADFPLDALLAVRVSAAGDVDVSVLDEEPVAPPGLVETLRSVYDAEVAEPQLPVTAEALVIGLLLRDREAFARPVPPFTELAAAAGLEQRDEEFAHDESIWAIAEEADRQFRMMHRLATPEDGLAAAEALEILSGEVTAPAALRRALDLLGSPEVLVVVVDELLDELPAEWGREAAEYDRERVAELVALADRLVAAAGRSSRAAVAEWVATVAAERDGRVLDAESHLRAAAQAGGGWELVEDRLAAYESDRGDAAAALGRWRSIEATEDDPDVVAVRPFARAAGPEPGRNEPCWCGSGRKYKQCHLGRPAAAPLAERVGWLHRKAVGYLERRGGEATDLLELHAEALGTDGAFDDPLVADTVLHESGWFARFLADRGPLLPVDEVELGTSWLTVDRGVYEVVDAEHVRDVRTGEQLPTAGPTAAVGERVCARALPDGTGRRVLVAVAAVERELEEELLAVLEVRDGLELLDLLAVDEPEPRAVLHTERARATPAAVSPVVRQLQERREQRWCDDPAPTLDGLTPRQAATDPSRREALLAAIAAVPPDDPVTGRLGLRPDRLRELLGLG